MTSSTSGSDQLAHPEATTRLVWRRWLVTFCGVFFGVGALLFTLLLLIDPYDTGRFPSFGIAGISDVSLRTADASRGRDPRFNAAVIGNSTAQRIDPYRLSAGSGLRFTQLSISKVGPREELVLMQWVLSHHARYGALVIVTDPLWCSPDPDRPLDSPFPFWLYGDDLDYLANVLSSRALDRAGWRLLIALGLRQPVDPVGFTDYLKTAERPAFVTPPPGPPEDFSEAQSLSQLPWVDRLRAFLATVPQSVHVILVMPPVYYTVLPHPGSEQAAAIDACKAALSQAVADRPLGSFLDFRVDSDGTRDATDFVDTIHYREKLAGQMADRIIAELRSGEAGADQADHAAAVTTVESRLNGRSN
ncbi:MAG TPA: hypothetical protein VKI44_30735 [Acetobacteraceae bacterium]|nr:hypothetical protein [Acetobacteraceae bacterium]